tara:strand:- start:1114 stop:2157 length:1044 start_codon:yes stop_codon:yes gene_type:complete
MSDLRIDNITNRTGDSGPVIAGVSTVSSTGAFTVPVGPTEMRGGRGRGLFSGGYQTGGGDKNIIDMIEIATTGNATDFGDLTTERRGTGGVTASSTRSVMIGGRDSPVNECVIDYVTFSSNGGASAFGELAGGVSNSGQCSSATRGICYSGARSNPSPATSDTISFITFASTGDASDFGEATSSLITCGGAQSPTRGLFAGGYNPAELKSIDYVTIASLGNGQHFGELTLTVRRVCGSSNSTRAIWAGGNQYPAAPAGVVDISYSTIATFGNAIDFGDLSSANAGAPAACASETRSVIHRAHPDSSPGNVLEYVTISTTGNAVDFGDLTNATEWGKGGSSDCHGGLG